MDGPFNVCRPEPAADKHQRGSNTCVTKASLGSFPDAISRPVNKVESQPTGRFSRHSRVEPYNASEKSRLIDCVGGWSWSESSQCRETVNIDDLDSDLDDIEIGLHTALSGSQVGSGSGPVDPDSTSPNFGWNPRSNSWSTVDSTESSDSAESLESVESLGLGVEPPEFALADHAAGLQLQCELRDLTASLCLGTERGDEIIPDMPTHSQRSPSAGGSSLDSDQEMVDDGCGDSIYSASESAYTGSIWMSDYSEGIPVLEEGHPLLSIIPAIVQETFLAFQRYQQRQHGGFESPPSGDYQNTTGGVQSDTSSQKKRRGKGGGGGGNEDGDDEKPPEKRVKRCKEVPGHQPSLACPYVKKDSVKYRKCYSYGLKRIQDVKQHLSRSHQLPFYCASCMEIFDTEIEHHDHERKRSCTQRDPIQFDGVTRAQKVLLAQRVPAKPKLSLAEQWFTIFDILFPDFQPRPKSAYINAELSVDLEAYQAFASVEAPNIITEAILQSGIWPDLDNEARDLFATILQGVIRDGQHLVAERWAAGMVLEPGAPPLIPSPTTQLSRTSSETLHENFEGYTEEQRQSQQVYTGEDEVEEDPEPRSAQATFSPRYDTPMDIAQPENNMGNVRVDAPAGGQQECYNDQDEDAFNYSFYLAGKDL